MRTLFADSGYWLALIYLRDQHHSQLGTWTEQGR